jgi:hypothetical protein
MRNLTEILKEAGILDKIAFGDVNNDWGLARLQGEKPGREPNNSFEDGLFDVINRWLGGSTNSIFNYKKQMPLLAKQYPAIFKPITPQGTILYRGLTQLSNKTRDYLIANSNPSDWIMMKEQYWLCKIPIQYVPHYKAQSWTDKLSVAQGFGDTGVLVTKQDSSFYFNKKALAVIYGESEHEVIHFGKDYTNPVYIAVNNDDYVDEILSRMQSKGKKIGFKDLASFYKRKKK